VAPKKLELNSCSWSEKYGLSPRYAIRAPHVTCEITYQRRCCWCWL